MNRHSQKGSALLIVLGFLSFMVVSAVAFAIWMRTERLPSSALRRSVANRYLVKAALAQAMSRVDDAIRSHPYPGAWNTNNQATAYRDKNNCAYDWWESRVFMPPDPEGVNTISGQPESRYAPITKTVSVLNLEALGYLPPMLVNDVRLLSRASWAAQWEYFNFDAGRYAFCAVNVSDMLDINKIAADSPRTSAAAARPAPSEKVPPPSRFSLAHLFRNGDNGFANLKVDDTFDKLTHTGLPDWPTAPLVSLLDYNLAMEDNKVGPLFSPFYFHLSGRTGNAGFYGGGRGSQQAIGAARQPFITDSWFPRSEHESSLNLRDIAQYQPFLPGERTSLFDVISGLTPEFMRKMVDEGHVFVMQDWMTLYDYLDVDNVPLSLSMPCAERVPMVTALGPLQGLQVEFSQGGGVQDGLKKTYDVKIKVTPPQLSSGIVFPFMNESGSDNGSYDVQAFMRLVFVDEGANTSDKPSAINLLRSKEFASLRPGNEAAWKADDGNQFKQEGNSCLLVNNFGTGTFKPDVQEPRDVYKNNGMVVLGSPQPFEETILQKIEYYKPKSKDEPNEPGELDKTCYQIVLPPFNDKGELLAGVVGTEMEESDFDAFRTAHNIRPYLMTWVRVKDGNKTVDLVPATLADDNVLNNFNNDNAIGPIGEPFGADKNAPILYFPSKMTFTYPDPKAMPPSTTMDWKYKACYTVDPRYNWAPENWWFEGAASPTLQTWYTRVFGTDEKDGNGILNQLVAAEFNGAVPDRGDRARDPVLFVSNLGYLQSVGEMAFLPRLSVMNNSSQPDCLLRDGAYDGAIRDRDEVQDCAKTMPCAGAAWKSYQNYRTNPSPSAFEFGANLYRRGLVNGPQGFYVNPFTQSKEVMLAAFANTPLNYWVAGTNYTAQGKSQTKKFKSDDVFDADASFRADYLAEYMMHRYEDLANMLTFDTAQMTGTRSYMIQKVWEDMFDALDWGGRMDANKTVEEIYRELASYYEGGGGNASGYAETYTRDNTYGELNYFVTKGSAPGIRLDVSRAVHKDEFADPLYYYNDRRMPSRVPTAGDYICDADRTFLHSYWRDCFANRQQLFLIFVRAESTALGGNGEGTPSQQGGRAVALVWRDPEAPTGTEIAENENNDFWGNRHPHKMRILFYRQLE